MTPEQKQAEFQLQIENLDFENAAEVARSLGITAQAVRNLGRPELEPAVQFLWTLAVGMSDKAVRLAELEGRQPLRTPEELADVLKKQVLRSLN